MLSRGRSIHTRRRRTVTKPCCPPPRPFSRARPFYKGPLSVALTQRQQMETYCTTPLILDYMAWKFTRGLPSVRDRKGLLLNMRSIVEPGATLVGCFVPTYATATLLTAVMTFGVERVLSIKSTSATCRGPFSMQGVPPGCCFCLSFDAGDCTWLTAARRRRRTLWRQGVVLRNVSAEGVRRRNAVEPDLLPGGEIHHRRTLVETG